MTLRQAQGTRQSTLTFDDSVPDAWRAALDPEGAGCAVCCQRVCAHSDPEYAGIVPPVHAAENAGG